MSKPIPPVSNYMTTCPITVVQETPLKDAHRLMRERGFRHLPVLEDGTLMGLLSDRDVALALSLGDADASKLLVSDAMTPRPFTVAPDSPLDSVAEELAERKIGSAVVVDHNRVVGVFTATDALTALAQLLRTRLAKA